MISPDAGGTDQVTQNRGYVVIPEVGDQVMVGFVHNHPDRHFVMGGMFHGGTALGGFVDNRVKSIMTRSGHKVVFTEDESIILRRQKKYKLLLYEKELVPQKAVALSQL